jgi:hypothetical protein
LPAALRRNAQVQPPPHRVVQLFKLAEHNLRRRHRAAKAGSNCPAGKGIRPAPSTASYFSRAPKKFSIWYKLFDIRDQK